MIFNSLFRCNRLSALLSYKQFSNLRLATHVIFDLDGTLLDSEHIYSNACQQIAYKFNRPFTTTLRSALIGLAQKEATPLILEKTGLKDDLTVKEFNELLNLVLSPMLTKSTMMPGALQLVKHLASHKIPMAICTSSSRSECRLKLENSELATLIPLVVTGDDPEIKNSKPAPDPYLVTMSRFKKKPNRPTDVLVFEDSLVGVQAAKSAGTRVTLVYDRRYAVPTANLDVDYIANSLEALDLASLGLPSYCSNL